MSAAPHRLLAFDTSTDQLSAALSVDGRVLQRSGPGAALASTTLIPMLQSLLKEAETSFAQLDAVVFGRGPGSFTGLRTACAAAQGIAYGAGGLPVLPVDTLAALAEEARSACGAGEVVATLDARMDEVYFQRLRWDAAHGVWRAADGPVRLASPQDITVPAGWLLVGNARAAYGQRLADGADSLHCLPTAAALLRLAPGLIAAGGLVAAADALPLYVRDKVAKTTDERAAERLAKDSALARG